MQWIAKYKDGSIVKQFDKGNITKTDELDRDKLRWFKVTEGTGDFNLRLNCDNGKLDFSNLDIQKLSKLSGGEKLSFEFDKGTNSFKLDRESFDFLDNIIIKREENYFYMQIDCLGVINVSGKTFCAGVIINGEDIPFYGRFPNFKVIVDGMQDIVMNGSLPVKMTEGITKYRILLDNVYTNGDISFDVKYEIVCDLIKWQSYVLGKVTPSKTIQCKLYTISGDRKEANPLELVSGCVFEINQFMGVI